MAAAREEDIRRAREWPVDLEIPMNELGCGDLVYELREQLARVGPSRPVRIVSNDPGAPAEIPAWCRLTRRRLLLAAPPWYVIENRP